MDKIIPIIPYLIPVIIIQLVLMIVALGDLIKRKKTRGPKWIWALVILLGEILGPIIYLVFGRVDED